MSHTNTMNYTNYANVAGTSSGSHCGSPCSNSTFINMVREAVADELGAVSMYAEMANMVQNLALKALITGIAGDEYGHARTWMTILALCGYQF